MSYLDAVHFAPHAPIDVNGLGCDFLTCSAYKFIGPHVGIMWGSRELLEQLPAYKVCMLALLKRIHGGESHAGKMPEGPGEEHRRKQQVRMLKRRLARLVEREAYEEAARLRDEIRSLENPDE